MVATIAVARLDDVLEHLGKIVLLTVGATHGVSVIGCSHGFVHKCLSEVSLVVCLSAEILVAGSIVILLDV